MGNLESHVAPKSLIFIFWIYYDNGTTGKTCISGKMQNSLCGMQVFKTVAKDLYADLLL